MSFYTIFDEQESLLTSTTTAAAVQAADPVLIHSTITSKKAQSTVGSINSIEAVTFFTTTIFTGPSTAVSAGAYSTSGSSAFVPNFGLTIFRSTGGSSAVWVLNDPTSVGLVKTLAFGSTSTSTLFQVVPVAATINSTAANAGSFVNLGNAGAISNLGNTVTLTAISTAIWHVTSHTTNPLFV